MLEGFAKYELPKKIGLLEHDFTIERGELTPKLSVKRKVVDKAYKRGRSERTPPSPIYLAISEVHFSDGSLAKRIAKLFKKLSDMPLPLLTSQMPGRAGKALKSSRRGA